jgi:hypothetical protein
VSRRNPWAILYASLIFGGISTPYLYLGTYAARGLFSAFEYADVLWLPLSTALFMGVFIARTPLEQSFGDRFGRLFPPLRLVLLLAALCDLMFITLLLMIQTLPRTLRPSPT